MAVISGNLPLLGPLFRGFFASKGNTADYASWTSPRPIHNASRSSKAPNIAVGVEGARNITIIRPKPSPRLFTLDRFGVDDEIEVGIEMDDKVVLFNRTTQIGESF